ncbi:MAG: class A beta-lactamase [Sphingomonas sp.]
MSDVTMRRRAVMGGLAALIAVPAMGARRRDGGPLGGVRLRDAVAECERASGGRLGVAVLDTATGTRFGWRGAERFPLCSTFKLLLCAAILRRVDTGVESLGRMIPVARADIVPHAPYTGQQVGRSVTVADLCRATMVLSDNAAANLLLPLIGGPAGIGAFARTLGDPATRLDRYEVALGACTPGDPRDTTTPEGMLTCMTPLLTGTALAPPSRAMLLGWLADNRTGAGKLAAGLPQGWRIGDKTGAGGYGTANDIAILWPPQRAPVLIASYLTQTAASAELRDATHANVARAVAQAIG